MEDCPGCGWPQAEVYEVLSRHLTSEGVVTYTRCACGEMQVRVQPYGPAAVVAAGPHPSPRSPHAPPPP
ncbi:hypothetical protein GEV43_35600 [Actinomadura sp. J1-007]|nr:hypothetical protein [Actinomadura sp. J1-007]